MLDFAWCKGNEILLSNIILFRITDLLLMLHSLMFKVTDLFTPQMHKCSLGSLNV